VQNAIFTTGQSVLEASAKSSRDVTMGIPPGWPLRI
jgi:hypothetical protein